MEQCTSRGIPNWLCGYFPIHHLLPISTPSQIRPKRQVFDTIIWWFVSILHKRRSCFWSWTFHHIATWRRSSTTSCWRSIIPCCQKSRYGLPWIASNTTRGPEAVPWWCFHHRYFFRGKNMEIMCISRENYRFKDKNDIETSRKNSRAFSSFVWRFFFSFLFSPNHLCKIPIKLQEMPEELGCPVFWVVRTVKM